MLDDALREIIRQELEAALQDLPRPEPEPVEGPGESWRSKLWRVEPATRLDLEECAEALGVSPRTVRRYIAGEGDRPSLPARRGPSGLSVRVEDLRTWISDVEEGQRFREESH